MKHVFFIVSILIFINSCQSGELRKRRTRTSQHSQSVTVVKSLTDSTALTIVDNKSIKSIPSNINKAYGIPKVISLCTWNLFNFGSTKSDAEIEFIANTVKNHDIVIIQEVVAKDPSGAEAVSRLADVLSRKGAKWDYRISDITSGESSKKNERYAFLWTPSNVTLISKPWLEIKYNAEIVREPFYATFSVMNKEFTLSNFHAITKDSMPEREVKYFKYIPEEYPDLNIIFCGDFNLPQSHTVFNPLKKMGYQPALSGQKTSLKQECINDDCLASEFDNFYFNSSKITLNSSCVIHFYKSFPNLKEARKISDHVPVVFSFSVN